MITEQDLKSHGFVNRDRTLRNTLKNKNSLKHKILVRKVKVVTLKFYQISETVEYGI